MKTFKELLLTLPFPYNYLAVLRTPKKLLSSKGLSLESALRQAFSWASTPKQEGHSFWKQVCDFATGESQSLPPIKGDAHYFATFLYNFSPSLKKKVLENIKKDKSFAVHQGKEVNPSWALDHSFNLEESIEGSSFWWEKDRLIGTMLRSSTSVEVVKAVKLPIKSEKVIVSFGGENYLIDNSELADFKTWAGSKKVKDFAQNKVKTISI